MKELIILWLTSIGVTLIASLYSSFKYSNNKCYWGHTWQRVSRRFVKGSDLGFGITNSFTAYEYKCSKCGKRAYTHYELPEK